MALISMEQIERSILNIRGHRVLLDADLAKIYGVSTKRLNEQVKRNLNRFPDDFMFQLSEKEEANLRSQFATSSESHGGRRYMPYSFTEHGKQPNGSSGQHPSRSGFHQSKKNTFIAR